MNKKSILKGIQVRAQLQEYLESIVKKRGIERDFDYSVKNDIDEELTLKLLAKATGQFKMAFLDQKGHYNLKRNNEKAYIHPESICFYAKNKPECIIYNEVIITKKIYLRDVSEIPS